MSFHVDPKTLLFTDLNQTDAETLEEQVTALVLIGSPTVWGTEAFSSWCKAANFDENNALLVMATAYPQRALLSLTQYYKNS